VGEFKSCHPDKKSQGLWSAETPAVESVALVYVDTGGVSLLDAGAVTA